MSRIFLIVTGASRGIGKAIVSMALSEGLDDSNSSNDSRKFDVLGISRSPNPGFDTDKLSWISLDLTDIKKSISILEPVLNKYSMELYDQYVLVNNAGFLGSIAPLGRQNSNNLESVIQLNTSVPLVLMNMFTRIFGELEAEKIIINISSGAGRTPYSGWSAYCASKAALDMMSLCFELEQGRRKNPVRVVSFAPGIVSTEMQETIAQASVEDFPLAETFREFRESGNMLEPGIPARAVLDMINGRKPVKEVIQDIRKG